MPSGWLSQIPRPQRFSVTGAIRTLSILLKRAGCGVSDRLITAAAMRQLSPPRNPAQRIDMKNFADRCVRQGQDQLGASGSAISATPPASRRVTPPRRTPVASAGRRRGSPALRRLAAGHCRFAARGSPVHVKAWPFRPWSMTTAQSAAVPILAQYSGHTHNLHAYQLRRWFDWRQCRPASRPTGAAIVRSEWAYWPLMFGTFARCRASCADRMV